MGNSCSSSPCCSCCCPCLRSQIPSPQKDEKEGNTSTPESFYESIDLDALASRISKILEKAKMVQATRSQLPDRKKWKLPESSDLSELKDFISDSAECSKDLTKVLNGDHGEDWRSTSQNLLLEVGKIHWAAIGLLLVGMTLKRFETISSNQEECMDLLDEMFRLCGYLKDVRDIQPLREQMGDLLEKSIQLVVEGAILCCSQSESSRFFQILGAAVHKKRLENIKNDIDKIHTHLMLQMSLYSVRKLNKSGVRLPRQNLYPSHAVGIDEAVAKVMDLLELDSDKKVAAVLLHGFPGTGKTTIADAVYASVDKQDLSFSKVCLFQNIGINPDVTQVQKDILDDISSITGEFSKPNSPTEGQTNLQQVLQQKQCFLYIDNVLSREELRKLMPKNLAQCKRLRILLTARDSTVSNALSVGSQNVKVFQVPSLKRDHAMALLCACMNAQSVSDCINQEQLEYVLNICGGIPLALEIVGCYISNQDDKDMACDVIRDEHERSGGESLALEKVDFLAFAFDSIEEACREAFLDICSFFLGCRWHVVECILGEDVLQILEHRALIKRKHVDFHQRVSIFKLEAVDVQMHDVILEIGRKRCEGNRISSLPQLRRLVSANEADLCGVKGIFLQESLDDLIVQLNGETLKMSADQLDMLSSSLRVFSTGVMDRFFAAVEISGKCKASFKKLVFWDSPKAEPPFVLNQCQELRDLDYSPRNPVTLSELPPSLRHLSIHLGNIEDQSQRVHLYVGEGTVLPNIRSMTLAINEVSHSTAIIPSRLFLPLKKLRELFLADFAILQLPDDFHHLEHLTIFSVERFSKLKGFPDNFGKCNSIRILHISDCPELESLPEELHNISCLESLLVLRCRALKKLPQNVGGCASLKMLSMEHCSELQELPDSFHNLRSLEFLRIEECENFRNLPRNFGKLRSLKTLNLSGCGNLKQLCTDFHCLHSLKELILNRCSALESHWMEELVKTKPLQVVDIKDSPQLIQKWQQMKDNTIKTKFIF